MNSNRVCSDIKGFLKDKINILILLLLISNLFYVSGIIYLSNNNKCTNLEVKNCIDAVKKCEKKVDFRYFNLTRSLEDIHKTNIDTKDGRIRITLQTITNR